MIEEVMTFFIFQKDLPISNAQMEYDKKNIGNHFKIKGRGVTYSRNLGKVFLKDNNIKK